MRYSVQLVAFAQTGVHIQQTEQKQACENCTFYVLIWSGLIGIKVKLDFFTLLVLTTWWPRIANHKHTFVQSKGEMSLLQVKGQT